MTYCERQLNILSLYPKIDQKLPQQTIKTASSNMFIHLNAFRSILKRQNVNKSTMTVHSNTLQPKSIKPKNISQISTVQKIPPISTDKKLTIRNKQNTPLKCSQCLAHNKA